MAAAAGGDCDEEDIDALRFTSCVVDSFELRRAMACAAAALPCSMTCLCANAKEWVSLGLADWVG